ncbi:hypothetical protein [Microbispora sp. NBRC 16548]|uniref:hypothetical protein n=1 Tax=Microbispora sp. NBRC 16548 TaxID=3030994 RepID=UPI0024A010CC|nr:hypothetical protein [Microbispora sp. NBRC 16548]GLX10046.1 hypothetical protein Misp03_69720 [Microbispora sp. NBRC 16548]
MTPEPAGGELTTKNAGKPHKSLNGVRKAEDKGDKKVVTDTPVRATLLRDADAPIVHHGGVRPVNTRYGARRRQAMAMTNRRRRHSAASTAAALAPVSL